MIDNDLHGSFLVRGLNRRVIQERTRRDEPRLIVSRSKGRKRVEGDGNLHSFDVRDNVCFSTPSFIPTFSERWCRETNENKIWTSLHACILTDTHVDDTLEVVVKDSVRVGSSRCSL